MDCSAYYEQLKIPDFDIKYTKIMSLNGFAVTYNNDYLRHLVNQYLYETDGDLTWWGKTMDFDRIICHAAGIGKDQPELLVELNTIQDCVFYLNGILFYSTKHSKFTPSLAIRAFMEAKYYILREIINQLDNVNLNDILHAILENQKGLPWIFHKALITCSGGLTTKYYADSKSEILEYVENEGDENG